MNLFLFIDNSMLFNNNKYILNTCLKTCIHGGYLFSFFRTNYLLASGKT